MTPPISGALDGVRVIDMTLFLAGPYCTMMLGDQGADVIKVEPRAGDYTRTNNPFHPTDTLRQVSGFFASVNRNKRSIVLDLKTAAGRDIFLELCRNADVIVENFRAGVMDRLGLSYEVLREINPRLVYAAIRGYGDPRTGKSPYSDWPTYDPIAQAMGGMMGITGPDRDTPVKIGPGVGDTIPAMMAAYGVVCALLRARQTGKGQFLDVSMVDAILATCERIVHQYEFQGVDPHPEGNRHPLFAPFGIVRTKDGWATVAAQNDPLWEKLCTLLDRPDLVADERSATAKARIANQDFVYDELERETTKFTKQELIKRLGGLVPFAPVYQISDIVADPHFAAREMLVEFAHPGCPGPVKITGIPVKMMDTPGAIRRPAPLLGEHTEEILSELGYDMAGIARLRQSHAIP